MDTQLHMANRRNCQRYEVFHSHDHRDGLDLAGNAPIRRILDTCARTRFRYVTAIILECGPSSLRFCLRPFLSVRRKTANAITGEDMGISIAPTHPALTGTD
jgi:hypothetical protein